MPEKTNLCRPSVSRRPAHNLFFAILPPPRTAERVSHLFQDLRARYPIHEKQISISRLHVSLVGVFAADFIPEGILRAAVMAGNAIRFAEFDLVLNRVLSFQNMKKEKPLVLAADADSTQSANRLVHSIRQSLSILSGIQFSSTGQITPHMTLVWDRITLSEQPITPIKLPVREIALIHSHVGKSRYDTLGRWELVPNI